MSSTNARRCSRHPPFSTEDATAQGTIYTECMCVDSYLLWEKIFLSIRQLCTGKKWDHLGLSVPVNPVRYAVEAFGNVYIVKIVNLLPFGGRLLSLLFVHCSLNFSQLQSIITLISIRHLDISSLSFELAFY